jgi:hypothetical protein
MWETSNFISEEFKGELLSSFYNAHVNYLEDLKEKMPTPFHNLMMHLYKAVQ